MEFKTCYKKDFYLFSSFTVCCKHHNICTESDWIQWLSTHTQRLKSLWRFSDLNDWIWTKNQRFTPNVVLHTQRATMKEQKWLQSLRTSTGVEFSLLPWEQCGQHQSFLSWFKVKDSGFWNAESAVTSVISGEQCESLTFRQTLALFCFPLLAAARWTLPPPGGCLWYIPDLKLIEVFQTSTSPEGETFRGHRVFR